MVNCVCKVPSSGCLIYLSPRCTRHCRSCMPEEPFAPWQSRKRFPLRSMGFNSPLYAGSNPAVCKYSISPVVWKMPETATKAVYNRTRNTFKTAMTPRRKPRFPTQWNTRLARKPIPCYVALCQKPAFRIEAKNTYVFGRLCSMSHCQR